MEYIYLAVTKYRYQIIRIPLIKETEKTWIVDNRSDDIEVVFGDSFLSYLPSRMAKTKYTCYSSMYAALQHLVSASENRILNLEKLLGEQVGIYGELAKFLRELSE